MRLQLSASLLFILSQTAPGQVVKSGSEAKQTAPVMVELAPGDPKSKLAPRYSPPGRQLKLTARPHPKLEGFDHLETSVELGPYGAATTLILARSEKAKPYNLLFVDGKPTKAEPKVVRNKIWTSFEAVCKINYATTGESAPVADYPVALWVVVDKETDTPDLIRLSRRGYLSGSVRLGEQEYDVVVSDANNDGVLGMGDWWELNPTNGPKGEMRVIGDHSWAGEKAWILKLRGASGRDGSLSQIDPGISRAEDLAKRDRFRDDRAAPRASKPIPFRKDVDAALKEALAKKSAYFIKFETDWCGPCKQMSQYVFTAKDVADAASGLVSIIVDGDAREDLTAKHSVRAYPTGILFDAHGKEIARYVGYQSVKETTAFLKRAK